MIQNNGSFVETQPILNITTPATTTVDRANARVDVAINNFVGDSGAGGTKGLVPAPAAGDAAAGKVLKADGTFGIVSGVAGGGLVLVQTVVASNSATIDLTAFSASYNDYVVRFQDLVPATDGADLYVRVSEDAGANWKAGASDYQYSSFGNSSNSNGLVGIASVGAAQIVVCPNIGSGVGEGCCGDMRVPNPSGSLRKFVDGLFYNINNAGNSVNRVSSGAYISTNAINGIRFLMSAGNIASGNFYLFGVAKT